MLVLVSARVSMVRALFSAPVGAGESPGESYGSKLSLFYLNGTVTVRASLT